MVRFVNFSTGDTVSKHCPADKYPVCNYVMPEEGTVLKKFLTPFLSYRICRSVSHCYGTNSYASFWGCDLYTECTESEMNIGIISRWSQN